MAFVQLMGNTKTKTFTNVLVALVFAAIIAGVAFSVGYLKAAGNCKTINVQKARKSLEASQAASRSTAEYTLQKQQDTVATNQLLDGVKHECLKTPMPTDLIDALNQ